MMALYKNTVLRVLEVTKGLQANEICAKLGISQVQYSNIKNGKLVPSKRIQDLLADFYGIPFEKLIEEFKDNGMVATAISKI